MRTREFLVFVPLLIRLEARVSLSASLSQQWFGSDSNILIASIWLLATFLTKNFTWVHLRVGVRKLYI